MEITIAQPRFIRRPEDDINHWNIQAWFDQARNTLVLLHAPKDPNRFIRHTQMALLFNDQAEYYAVCYACRTKFAHMQWRGSTRDPLWRNRSAYYLANHIQTKGWCEFCDPVFGNGGWIGA